MSVFPPFVVRMIVRCMCGTSAGEIDDAALPDQQNEQENTGSPDDDDHDQRPSRLAGAGTAAGADDFAAGADDFAADADDFEGLRYSDALERLASRGGGLDAVLADMQARAAKRLHLSVQGWWMQVDGVDGGAKVPITKAIGETTQEIGDTVSSRGRKRKATSCPNM
jgi:hypothetical protein